MIFMHTLPTVLDGSKTSTCRIRQWGEELRDGVLYDAKGQVKYKVGGIYAVQAGRGEKGLAHIVITSIEPFYILDATEADAQTEGFATVREFWQLWNKMHGKPTFEYYFNKLHLSNEDLLTIFKTADFPFWQSWRIRFELKKEA